MIKSQIENFEDLVPLTYFIRKGGLCYIESSVDAKIGGVHVATAANEQFAKIIIETINANYQ